MNTLRFPKSEESERAILAILSLSPERFAEVADELSASDFSLTSIQQIWTAMTTLYKEGVAFDLVSLSAQLKKQEIKPEPAVEELFDVFEHPSVIGGNLLHFAKIVKNASTLRKVMTFTYEKLNEAQVEDADASTVLAGLEAGVVELSDGVLEQHSPEVSKIVEEVDADYEKVKKEGWKGINTGFDSLDFLTGGLIKTQVWIVGAYTGVGKTFFALQVALNVLKQGGKVLVVSTEMDRKTNILRLMGNLADIGTLRLMKADLTDEERANRREAIRTMGEWKDRLFIYDNTYTVEQIRLKAKKVKLQQGLDLVIVDFIQNMQSSTGEGIYERMSSAAVGLQNLAKELNVTMMIASQVNQDAAGWKSKDAIEYKGAGEIAAVADVGVWLTKGDGEEDIAVDEEQGKYLKPRVIHLRKTRHGHQKKIRALLSFPSGRFTEQGGNEPKVKETQGQIKPEELF